MYTFVMLESRAMKKNKSLLILVVGLFMVHNLYSQRKMITPEFLQKGDTIGILATARKIDETALKPAIKILESWGLRVVLGKTIGKEDHQLAGPDWLRAEDFQQMLDNPKIKAILGAKGGYGTVRMVDRIDFSSFKQKPKWIIGFSDMTVLHSHINQMGIETLHAIMAQSFEKASPEALESLRKALFGEPLKYKIPAHPFNHKGSAKGELVGGNLSVIYSIIGSKSALDYKGKILFIEDLDEYLYHIDRMMMNLKRNGYFDGLKAVIVGGMTSMNDNEIPWGKDALEIIQDVLKDTKIPVIYNFPAGHIKDNRALILGKTVQVNTTDSGAEVTFM